MRWIGRIAWSGLCTIAVAHRSDPDVDSFVDSCVAKLKANWSLRESDTLGYAIAKAHGEARVFWHYQRADGKTRFRLLLLAPSYLPMIEASSREKDPELRWASAFLLGNEAEAGERERVRLKILERLLDDPSPRVRLKALLQLDNLPVDPAREFRVPINLRKLDDSDQYVRIQSGKELINHWGDWRGLRPMIRDLIANPLPPAKMDMEHVDQWDVLSGANSAIIAFGTRAVPLIVPCLSSPKPGTKIAALGILNVIRPLSLVEIARPLVSDAEPHVRIAAFQAIASQRRPEAIPILINGLGDRDANVVSDVEFFLREGDVNQSYVEKYWKEGCRALKKAKPTAWIPDLP
jgi:HEAT repeat protein